MIAQAEQHLDELNRVGFSRALLGVSGGVDSAVSLYLCAKALGPENVLALRMPYKTSPDNTLEDAQKKVKAAEKEAAEAVAAAEKARATVAELNAKDEVIDEEIKARAEKAAEEAEKQADKMSRKAAKAAAKAETAAREAEASGVLKANKEEE